MKALTISSASDKSYESESETNSDRIQNEESSSSSISIIEVEVINKCSVHNSYPDYQKKYALLLSVIHCL